MSETRTELEKLGEFGLIERIAKNVSKFQESTIKGIGDDAAVIAHEDEVTLISTDMLSEGVHFDLMYTPLKHLGYKSVVVNLSDIYAMNATPKQITVSIAMSNRFSLEAIDELYTGINAACAVYGVDLIGGDTTSSKSGLVLSITAVGTAKKDEVVYRNTAKEGDLLVVTGDLGGAYMGLQLLEREKEVFKAASTVQPDLEGNDYILERQLKPEARKDVFEQMNKEKIKPSAMIDISDGLSSEIIHISRQSELGCTLYEDKIPIDHTTYDAARKFNLDPTLCALSGGEDYELLFTIPQSEFDKVKNNPNMSVIGYMTDKNSGYQLVTKQGSIHPLEAQGWDPILREEAPKEGKQTK